MANIDKRVVEMKFDNAQFERETAKTVGTLAKLKASLGNLSSSASAINIKTNAAGLQPLSRGVDALVTKFSALQVAGVTAIANVANKAVNAGTQIVNSLTIGPISGGLAEYEKKIGSIQTVLANTEAAGTTLSDVTKALDNLNTYSDKTIYNFGEMARNIGTFTAAGVDLDTATGAIKGIANLAALSGSTSEQASGAMYQLSQAISEGRLSLESYNSVVNAGLGGAIFQKAIVNTAVAMGTLDAKSVKLDATTKKLSINGKSFRESIMAKPGEKSFVTSEVLTTALKNFTGDMKEADLVAQGFTKSQAAAIMAQAVTASDAATKVKTASQLLSTLKESAESGFAKTFEILIGDFKTAPILFTKINNTIGGIIGRSADARNKILQDFTFDNGRHFLLSGLSNAFTALKSIIEPISKSFRDIFPATTGKQLADLARNFQSFTKGLILGKDNMENLRRTFRGLFAVVGVVSQVIKGVLKSIFSLFPATQGAGSGFLAITAIVGDFLYGLSKVLTYKDPIGKFFAVLVSPLTLLKPLISLVVSLAQAISSLFSGDVNFDKFFVQIAKSFSVFGQSFSSIGQKVKDFLGSIGDSFNGLTSKLNVKFLSDLTSPFKSFIALLQNLGNSVSSLFSGKINVGQFFNSIKSSFIIFGGSFSFVGDKVKEFFSSVGKSFDAFSSYLNAKAGQIASKGNTIGAGIIGGLAKVIQFLRSFTKDAQGTIANVIKSFDQASSKAKVFLNGVGGSGLDKLKAAITKVIEKISELKSSLDISGKFKNFNSGANQTASSGVSALSKVFSFASVIFSAIGGLFSGLSNFVSPFFSELGQFFTTVVARVKNYIATMDNQDLVAALNSGILVLLYVAFKKFVGNLNGTLGAFSNAAKSIGGTFDALKNSLSALTGAVRASIVLQIAVAVGVLVAALFVLAKIDSGALKQAIVTLGVLFTQMGVLFLVLTKIPIEKLAGAGAAMIGVSLGVLILSVALERLGKLDPKVLMQGGLAIASLLAAMAGFAKLLTFAPGILAASAAMVIIAGALTLLSGVIVLYSNIPFNTMIQGLAAMAAVMLTLGLTLRAFPFSSLKSASGIAIIAFALTLLAPALALLGTLPLEVISKGLITVATMMIILSIAANALNGSIAGATAMLIMAAAITALVPALALLGALPFDIIKKGLFAIAAIMAIFVLGMIALTPVIAVLALFSTSILILAGAVLIAASGFYIFVKALGLLLLIGPAGFAIIVAGVTTLLAILPLIAQQAGYALNTFVKVIRDSAPKLIEAAGYIFQTFTAEIARRIPAVAANGLDMIIGLLNAISSRIGLITNAAINIVVNFINAIRERLPLIIQSGIEFIISFIEGLASAIRGNRERIGSAGADLATALVQGLASGLGSLGGILRTAIVNLGSSVVRTFKSFFGIHSPSTVFAGIGLNIVQGLANGISGSFRLVKDAAIGLGKKLPGWMQKVLGVHSPSTVFAEIGMFLVKGLSLGLDSNTISVERSATNVGEAATNAMKNSLKNLSNVSTENMDLIPIITPVFDLTDIKKGSDSINQLLSINPVDVSATINTAKDVSSKYNSDQNVTTTNSVQAQRDIQTLVASIAAKNDAPAAVPVLPRPVEFHIGTIQDGDSLVRRARATNKMLSLAEGGDSSQLERIL